MGTGAPSNSNGRKNPSEDRKRKKKATRMAKPSKRRRHDSPSSPSRSDYSSPSTYSSESGGGRASHGRDSKRDVLVRRRRSPSPDGGLSRRRKKKKSYQSGRDLSKRRDSRSRPSKGDRRKKRPRHRSSGKRASIGSLDEYSSRSCSTSRSGSSTPDRAKSDRSLRSKGKVLKVGSSTRDRSSRREKERSGRRRSHGRCRSPSSSSYSRCSHERRTGSLDGRSGNKHHHDEERLAQKSQSRCLPSSFNSAKHSSEVEGRHHSGKYENEEEIIEDFDDPYTSRSNESYEGSRKRDSQMDPLPPSQRAREGKMHGGSSGGTDEEEVDLKRETLSSVVVPGFEDGAQLGNRNDSPVPRGTRTRLKSQVSTSGGCSEVDELELLLRQKALENFKKFRARISTNANFVEEQKDESIPIKAHNVTIGKSEAAQFHESARPINTPSKPKSYTSLEHCVRATDGSQHSQFTSTSVANAPAQACSLVEKTERNNRKLMQRHPSDAMNTESVPGSLFSHADPCLNKFQVESSEKIFAEDLSNKNMLDNKNNAKAGDTDMHSEEANKVDVSASMDASSHKNASEFEQKTMSVMHGGEVVQVSYKVYIPKKTPALARRRLQH